MRRETEMLFEHVVRKDRSLLELLDSDYTFLNERLAKYYGIPGVKGEEMRQVTLPPDSPRGGVLTQGTVLTVTSNPDRTSPVKRGLFILDNILGTPPPPPPAGHPAAGRRRQEARRARTPPCARCWPCTASMPSCSSCHNRMDPLGPGAGELQRPGALARQGARAADRRRGAAGHRRVVHRRSAS